MPIFSNMTDRTVTRAFPWIWFIRLAQIFIAFLVLILAAVDINSVKNFADGCGVPHRIAYNLACAVLAIFALIYFILATGPTNVFKVLPWIVWGQIALDAVMLIFWLAAAATSEFTNQDLCDACSNVEFYYEGYYFTCSDVLTRDLSRVSRAPAGLEKRRSSTRRAAKKGTTLGRTALDSIETVLFFVTLVATIWWVITQRRSSGTAAPTTRPPAHEESGVPMTSTQPSAPVGPNSQTQPAQYYVGQDQAQQQQQQQYAYQQPIPQQAVPQSQIPPQPQQAVPQSQYPPQPQQQFVHQQQ